MATREVSTWAELVAAIRASGDSDTVKLIADINCDNEIPEGVSSTITTSAAYLKIDGEYVEDGVTKRHEIRNLRSSTNSPVTIFKITTSKYTDSFTMKGIDFLNLILSAPLLEDYNYTAGNNNTVNIQNCRFTGKRTSPLMKMTRGSNERTTFNFQRCYCNMIYNGNTHSNLPLFDLYTTGIGYMSNCRIRETFAGTYTPSSSDGEATCSVFNMRLSGCRVEGEVVSGKNPRYHSDAAMSGYTPAAQNVYDVDFKLTNNTDTSVPLYAFKGVVKVPIRKKDDESTTYTISSASTGVIQATESQMQDASWLAQQGFDIVPSNQGG